MATSSDGACRPSARRTPLCSGALLKYGIDISKLQVTELGRVRWRDGHRARQRRRPGRRAVLDPGRTSPRTTSSSSRTTWPPSLPMPSLRWSGTTCCGRSRPRVSTSRPSSIRLGCHHHQRPHVLQPARRRQPRGRGGRGQGVPDLEGSAARGVHGPLAVPPRSAQSGRQPAAALLICGPVSRRAPLRQACVPRVRLSSDTVVTTGGPSEIWVDAHCRVVRPVAAGCSGYRRRRPGLSGSSPRDRSSDDLRVQPHPMSGRRSLPDAVEGQDYVCGFVSVPQRHAVQQARRSSSQRSRILATGDERQPDLVVFAQGGPGSWVWISPPPPRCSPRHSRIVTWSCSISADPAFRAVPPLRRARRGARGADGSDLPADDVLDADAAAYAACTARNTQPLATTCPPSTP